MTDVIKKETSPEVSEQIIPEEKTLVNDYDIDAFLEKRKEFIEKVNAIMVKGADYHEIQGKKSLAKGGAEKIASIFGWTASFTRDVETSEAFGKIDGLIAFVCTLRKSENLVGQGRGASILVKNSGDPNKTIKMAQKSAFIDAVLRASGLSDFFTQDIEDMDQKEITGSNHSQPIGIPASAKQLALIEDLMGQKRVTETEVYDWGFDLRNLTGGKEGTASELITALMKTAPGGLALETNDEGLTELGETFIEDLKDCATAESYKKITDEITQARNEKKLSGGDWSAIKQQAIETAKRLS